MRHYSKQTIAAQVTGDMKERIGRVADKFGLSMSDIVRMCIERGLVEMESGDPPKFFP